MTSLHCYARLVAIFLSSTTRYLFSTQHRFKNETKNYKHHESPSAPRTMLPQSSSKAGTANYYFPTTLPPEALPHIIEQALAKSYLDHDHTSRFPRNLIKFNANRICNEVVGSCLPFGAAILGIKLEAGWLVPPYDQVTADEVNFSGSQRLLVNGDWTGSSLAYCASHERRETVESARCRRVCSICTSSERDSSILCQSKRLRGGHGCAKYPAGLYWKVENTSLVSGG
jgi:hypothetical protein